MPLSKLMTDQIGALKAWAKGRARLATSIGVEKQGRRLMVHGAGKGEIIVIMDSSVLAIGDREPLEGPEEGIQAGHGGCG